MNPIFLINFNPQKFLVIIRNRTPKSNVPFVMDVVNLLDTNAGIASIATLPRKDKMKNR
jgi:hypothetical protein